MARRRVTYLEVIKPTMNWVDKNPGVDRTRLLRWMMSVFGIKSSRAKVFIDKLETDDYIRRIKSVDPEYLKWYKINKSKRGRPKTRYIKTQR